MDEKQPRPRGESLDAESAAEERLVAEPQGSDAEEAESGEAEEHYPRGAGPWLTVSEREGKILWAVACGIAFLLALGVSYLDEDAFISFRVVDNFVRGEGLRWNVSERVQVYTNPLWVLGLSVVQAAVRNIAWTSYALSAVASAAAVGVIARPQQRRPVLLCLLLLPLLLSRAFTDYTSSGLENPFLYLFSALFIERAFRHDAYSKEELPSTFRYLTLYAALCSVTRADTFLMFAPLLLGLSWRHRRKLPLGQIALGALPLLCWLGFAYLYYGTIFPNPKYAKLDGGIARTVYLEFGWTYLRDMARNDVVTFCGLVLAPTLAVVGFSRTRGGHRLGLLGLGATLYILYVIWVGGDFMAGRYWSTPFFFVVSSASLRLAELLFVLADEDGAYVPEASAAHGASDAPPMAQAALSKQLLYGTIALLVARFVVQPFTEQREVIFPREQGRFAIVRDGEIRVQRYNCGFFEALLSKRGGPEKHSWSEEGHKQARRAAILLERSPDERYVVISSAAGKGPFYAGPLVDYVDPLGITDPLLARLPDADGRLRLIGHLQRRIPRGYIKARENGDTSDMDPYLRKYWEALRTINTAPLFDPERLRTLFRMTGGAYDELLAHYIEHGEARPERRRIVHGHH